MIGYEEENSGLAADHIRAKEQIQLGLDVVIVLWKKETSGLK